MRRDVQAVIFHEDVLLTPKHSQSCEIMVPWTQEMQFKIDPEIVIAAVCELRIPQRPNL